jgi:hypothetical protein
MKPRRNGSRLLFVLLVVLAMLSVAAVAIAGPKGARPDRPFKAGFSGTREFAADPGRCADLGEGWNLLVIELTGGHATHLGRITGTADQCIKGTDIVDGDATYLAANGDELSATYTGKVISVSPEGVAVIEVGQSFDGGTGRFEYATGDAYEVVSVDLVTGTVHGTVKGTISY